MSRYGSGTGAFLLPVYGGGELPQAFCRVAAVADALYVLRQGIGKFVMDADTGLCQALLTSSGQVGIKLACFAAAGDALHAEEVCGKEGGPHGVIRWENIRHALDCSFMGNVSHDNYSSSKGVCRS